MANIDGTALGEQLSGDSADDTIRAAAVTTSCGAAAATTF